MSIRARTVAVLVASFVACTSSAPPTAPTGTAPGADAGPPPGIPITDGASLTLTNAGVAPKQVRVYQSSRVTFTNTDASGHDIESDPLHLHSAPCSAQRGSTNTVP